MVRVSVLIGYQVGLTLLVPDPAHSAVDWNIEEATDSELLHTHTTHTHTTHTHNSHPHNTHTRHLQEFCCLFSVILAYLDLLISPSVHR